jgi:nucleotide-binding universal stress UspA family protein
MGFRKILAAIDHSPLCETVFEQALELAKANQASLMLYHCLTADTVLLSPPFAGELGLPPHYINQSYQSEMVRLEQQMQHTKSLLAHYCQLATAQGISTEWNYQTIEPGQGLCQMAQRWGADLVVLGRRGRKGLSEALLGSVSNYVLHHAPCAVLVIQSEVAEAPTPSTESDTHKTPATRTR